MSDPNGPPPSFPFSYSPSYTPSDFQDSSASNNDNNNNNNNPPFADWPVHPYPQPHPSFAFQGFDPIANNFSQGPVPQNHPLTSDNRTWNSKVPIPRASSNQVAPSGRVSRACNNCRDQKAKCSGDKPCQRCKESGFACSYGDRKREKTQKEITFLKEKGEAYETILRELFPRLDSQSAQRVQRILDQYYTDDKDHEQLPHKIRVTAVSPVNIGSDQAPDIASAASVSSLGAMDYTDEDFNRDERAQALGFVGEHSMIAWVYRLKRELENEHVGRPSPGSPRESWDRQSVASVNFFLDDAGVPIIPDVDISQRPPQALADRLVDHYFQNVHPQFPIVGKVTFLQQYASFCSSPFARPGRKWLAILNFIFAIASKFSHPMQGNVDLTQDNHVVYFSRAWKLSMSNTALLDHPNLQQVQVEGLAAYYLVSVGQMNRSWRICGISIRSAVTMGLNLRSESSAVAHVSKELRYRVWWALYKFDSTLSLMTGRPPSSNDTFCTTPLPVPFEEETFRDEGVEQLIKDHDARSYLMSSLAFKGSDGAVAESSTNPEAPAFRVPDTGKPHEKIASRAVELLTPNMSLFFLCELDLILIARESVDTVYAPGNAWKSGSEIDMVTSLLNNKADAWLSNLPPAFRFLNVSELNPIRFDMAVRFYGAKVLISQPCLRRLTRRASGSTPPGRLCEAMADVCIASASQWLNLLPDQFDKSWLKRIAPWSSILHSLMQCIVVLLDELYYRARPGTAQRSQVLSDTRKTAMWLRAMAQTDLPHQRAWLVCKDLLSRRAPELSMKEDSPP